MAVQINLLHMKQPYITHNGQQTGPYTPNERPLMPRTYHTWSIIVTLFGFLIGGIVAIVFSSQVSSRYIVGDYEGATRASRQARTWVIVSGCIGILKWMAVALCAFVLFYMSKLGYFDRLSASI